MFIWRHKGCIILIYVYIIDGNVIAFIYSTTNRLFSFVKISKKLNCFLKRSFVSTQELKQQKISYIST